jgi:hypothetical protein
MIRVKPFLSDGGQKREYRCEVHTKKKKEKKRKKKIILSTRKIAMKESPRTTD